MTSPTKRVGYKITKKNKIQISTTKHKKNFRSNHQTNKENTTTFFQLHKKYTKEDTIIVQYYTKNTKTNSST